MGKFAQMLKQRRQLKALTLSEVAKKAELSEGYICDIEKARRLPAYDTLDRLATALNEEPIVLYRAYAADIGYYRVPYFQDREHQNLVQDLLEWESIRK